MLCRTKLTLLFAFVGISRIEARDQANTIVEALAVQNDNTFNTGPNDKSIYGSVVKVKDIIYDSPDSRRPISTQTRTAVVVGGPGHDGVSYAKSEERDQQGQPKNRVSATTHMSGNTFNISPDTKLLAGSYIEQNNNVYKSRDGNNQTQLNKKHKSSNSGPIAESTLTDNVVQTSGGSMVINLGSSITRNGHVYVPDKDSQNGEMTINGTGKPDELSNAIKKILEASRIEWNNEFFQQDPTGSKPGTGSNRVVMTSGGSSTINLGSLITRNGHVVASDMDSQSREMTINGMNQLDTQQYPTGRKSVSSFISDDSDASAEKHNGQPSLSPNVYYLFTYFLIMLIKLSVLH